MNTPWVEQDCTIEFEGREFTSGGAFISDTYAIGYVGKTIHTGCRLLTDWHGNQIGTCYLSSSWPVRSYIGSRMYQIYATINGIQYTGRGFGEGMSVRLKRCAKQ